MWGSEGGVGPARHSSSETEEEKGKRDREREELPALLSMCLFSEKCNPSCTSTMPAQNDRGYCTPNHCVVGGGGERQKDNRCELRAVKEGERDR